MPSLNSRIPDSICFSIKYSPKYFNGKYEIRKGLKSLTLLVHLQDKTGSMCFLLVEQLMNLSPKFKICNILGIPLKNFF